MLYPNENGDSLFIADYVRLRSLVPADTPMLHVFHHLPMELFDHTTEGIAVDDMEHLGVDGFTDIYKIQQVTPQYLRVDYTGGHLELRRFPLRVAASFIAALITNGRARTLEMWKLKALHQGR